MEGSRGRSRLTAIHGSDDLSKSCCLRLPAACRKALTALGRQGKETANVMQPQAQADACETGIIAFAHHAVLHPRKEFNNTQTMRYPSFAILLFERG